MALRNWLVLIIPFFLLGCGLVGVSPEETVEPSRTSIPFTPQTESPLPTPTDTPRPISPACRTDIVPADLSAAGYADYPQAVLAYLNAGGSPVALSDLLNVRGVAAQPVSVVVADFTGDGRDDVGVALVDPQSESLDSRLLIYACRLAEYELVLNQRGASEYRLGFHIWGWRDLNADSAVELVVSQGLCGAHTCFDDFQVLSYDGAGFTDRLVGNTTELPFPTMRTSDPDGDGLFRLEISTAGFGSVGAGPQRPATWIWDYDPGASAWIFEQQLFSPSPYRIHVLHDADDASARADYDYAVTQYRRVIDEAGLDDWTLGAEGRAGLAAYARFRIFAIAVALQDPAAVESALAEMESTYPAGGAYRDYVEMAILFRNAYNSGGLGAACTAAAGFADSHAETILEPLGSGVYGYANRDYTGESMCPAPVPENEGESGG